MSAEVLLHTLFFAALPDGPAAERAHRLAGTLAGRHGLRGRPLRPERLHVSLSKVGMSPSPPPAKVIDLARRVGDQIALPPFKVAFDRVQSWRRSNGPVVLVGGEERVVGLNWLGHALAEGQGMRPRHFVPHVSLIWSPDFLAERAVEPFSWMVREFVLLHSIHGEGRHEVVGRWPLGGRGGLTAAANPGSGAPRQNAGRPGERRTQAAGGLGGHGDHAA
jgi:2'-5' RNA ligase